MKKTLLLLCIAAVLVFSACTANTRELQNGYYTAEVAEFDSHGWKEFITIYVRDGRIVTAEYNAKSPSGFIKSWDLGYMSTMNAQCGTYPNQYTRAYAAMLLQGQTDPQIDVLTGATHSHHSFALLCEAVLEKAMIGDSSVAQVIVPESED